MKPKRALFIPLLVLILAGFCPAKDTIKLKNGNRFRGIIRGESDGMIKVEIAPGMMMTFPKDDVAEVIRGKHPPPPPQPQPEPQPQEPQPQPEQPTLAGIQQTIARLIYNGKFTEAMACCGEAENDPQLQAMTPQIAVLRKDIQQVEAIWQKVKGALPAMKGKEVLFRDGVGVPMVTLTGNQIVAQAGLSRPLYELDPDLALSLAKITGPAPRGVFLFYARKWDAARKELQRAAATGADVKGYLERIRNALAGAAQEAQQRTKAIQERKTQIESLAERQKAIADVLKLGRRADSALDGRKFQEALQLLQEARNIAVQSLPSARVKKIDEKIQEVVENSRVVLDIAIQEVYVPSGYMDYATRMEKKATIDRGERWSKKQRMEVENRLHESLAQQIANQIAMAVAQPLQAIGYLVVQPNQLQPGERTSLLRIAYREYPIVGDISPWAPPIPGPVWPVYGVAVHIDSKLDLLDPYSREVWSDEINMTTPLSAGDGSFVSQSGRAAFLQQLQMLTFQPEEE
ncbi:MAG: hypothetical protein GXP25_23675 [Planctomycetes bacterium]|nr:hypothetical protein [Planctomycetota bacterium]